MSSEPIDVDRALRFLAALSAHNDRAWFAANRGAYDDHVKPEFDDLVAALLATHVARDERFAYVDPRTCVFRLHRDTRFSADKTPYKDWISAFLSPRGKSGANVGYYVQISPGDCMFAAGLYTPEKDTLARVRRHFAETSARAFDRVLAAKNIAPYLPLETEPLKVAPRGFPKDHPRPELVRARRYMLHRRYSDAAFARAGAFATFRAAMRDCAPFVAYLERAAGLDEPPDRDFTE